MVPNINTDIQRLTLKEEPDKAFRLMNKKIVGTVDGIEAIKQAIYLMLNIERYDYMIFSWNYGVEIKDLIGLEAGYVYSELKRRIEEALTQDDRIQSVDAFSFAKERGKVKVFFIAHTIYGDIDEETEVSI